MAKKKKDDQDASNLLKGINIVPLEKSSGGPPLNYGQEYPRIAKVPLFSAPLEDNDKSVAVDELSSGHKCWCGNEMIKDFEDVGGEILPVWKCDRGVDHDSYPA